MLIKKQLPSKHTAHFGKIEKTAKAREQQIRLGTPSSNPRMHNALTRIFDKVNSSYN